MKAVGEKEECTQDITGRQHGIVEWDVQGEHHVYEPRLAVS